MTSNIFLGTTNQGRITYNFNTTNMTLGNGNAEVVNIASNQNVGIGFPNTDTPAYKLDISGGSMNLRDGAVIRIDGVSVLSKNTLEIGITESSLESVATLFSLDVSGDLTVGGNDQSFHVDATNKRIGVGTTAPTVALDVVGSGQISVDLLVQGDLTVNGDMTTFNTETLAVEDPLIKLATNNAADTVDTGFYALYNDGTSKYAGLFRDASDSIFKFFQGTTVEPNVTVETIAANGYSTASILVNDVTATTGNISGNLAVDSNTLYVDASVNSVGIGTTTPTNTLDVIGTIGVSGDILPLLDNTFSLGTTTVRFKEAFLTSGTLHIGDATISEENGTLIFGNSSGTPGDFAVNNETLYVDVSTTRVGIAMSTPAYKLDVSGGDINTDSVYRIVGTEVLGLNTLGTGVTSSSITNNSVNFTNAGTMNLTTGNDYQINSVSVLSNDTLGIGITQSNIDSNTGNLTNTGTINVTTGNDYQVAGTSVLTGITLGTGVVNSNITSNTGNLTNIGTMNVTSGNDYQVDGTSVLAGVTLGAVVVNSSLTSVGNLTNLTVDTNTLVVDESANSVGIGITNPSTFLDISVSSSSNSSQLKITNISDVSRAGLTLNADDLDFNIQLRGDNQQAVIDNLNAGGIGVFAKDTGDIRFHTTDTDNERLTILNNGNIGISNSAPSYKLDVIGDINFTGILRQNGAAINADAWADGITGVFNTDLNNVGIGTSNPAYDLDVSGDINFSGILRQNGTTFETGWATEGNDLYNLNSGNVGIGTTTPAYDLDVIGDINFSGILRQNGTTFETGWATEGNDLYNLNSGNVGIGTTTPLTSLHIDATDNIILPVGTDAQRVDAQGGIRFNTDSTTFEGYDGSNWGSLGGIKDVDGNTFISAEDNPGDNNNQLKFVTDGTERMRIEPGVTGYIGIATTSPAYALDVSGDVNVSGNFRVGGAEVAFDTWLKVGDDIYANNTGNVGIGTTLPTKKLDIIGGAQVGQDLVVQGNIFLKGVSAGNGDLNGLWGTTDGSNIHTLQTGTIGISGDILPLSNEVFNLGTTLFRFKDLFLSGSSIHLGATAIISADDTGTVDMSSGGGDFVVDGDNQTFFVDVSQQFVGIGTTAPNYKLEVNNGTTGTIASFYGPSAGRELRIDNSSTSFDGDTYTFNAVSSGGEIAFATNAGTERMRIENGGNVGIGTDDPGTLLDVRGPVTIVDTFTLYIGDETDARIGDRCFLGLANDTNRRLSLGIVDNQDPQCYIEFSHTNNTSDAAIKFFITDTNAIPAVEAMRIAKEGNLVIGLTAPKSTGASIIHSTASTSVALEVMRGTGGASSDVLRILSNVGSSSTIHLAIAADGDVTNTNDSYGPISDIRLKENIVDANSQWEDIKAIRFRNFNFINTPNQPQLGVIADELELTSPGLVKITEQSRLVNGEIIENIKSVKSTVLRTKGLVALQEAIARIEELEAKVLVLENQ